MQERPTADQIEQEHQSRADQVWGRVRGIFMGRKKAVSMALAVTLPLVAGCGETMDPSLYPPATPIASPEGHIPPEQATAQAWQELYERLQQMPELKQVKITVKAGNTVEQILRDHLGFEDASPGEIREALLYFEGLNQGRSADFIIAGETYTFPVAPLPANGYFGPGSPSQP